MDNKNIFASNLQIYMRRNDKSRTDIAEALGVSYYTVTDWVKGKKYPRMDKVEMLAKYFGIKKSDLIEEKTIETHPVETAERHIEMIMDADLNEIYDYLKLMDDSKRKIAKGLLRSLVETETEA